MPKKGERKPLVERLMGKVRHDDSGCWTWTGATTRNGYGKIGCGSTGQDPMRYVHRLSYELNIGPIPAGLVIDHLCRNRLCVNPAHLEAVTIGENVLRGEGITATHARRTSCQRGHPFSGDNLKIEGDGGRRCLACQKANRLAKRAAK